MRPYQVHGGVACCGALFALIGQSLRHTEAMPPSVVEAGVVVVVLPVATPVENEPPSELQV
jgi:hypothetical protein